jgi:hypothetical protein
MPIILARIAIFMLNYSTTFGVPETYWGIE